MFDNAYTFTGKHAYYVRYLCGLDASGYKTKTNIESGGDRLKIFETYRDVYVLAPVLGFIFNRKSGRSKSLDELKLELNGDIQIDDAVIRQDAMKNVYSELEFIYRLIMLLDESNGNSVGDRISRAFRDDATEDKNNRVEENMVMFDSYVLGGVEILYEKLTEGCTSKEDYIDRIFGFVEEFQKDID